MYSHKHQETEERAASWEQQNYKTLEHQSRDWLWYTLVLPRMSSCPLLPAPRVLSPEVGMALAIGAMTGDATSRQKPLRAEFSPWNLMSQDSASIPRVPSDHDKQGSLLTLWTCTVREESTFVVPSLGDPGGCYRSVAWWSLTRTLIGLCFIFSAECL